MTEPHRNTLAVRHEIERTRGDLLTNVGRLRTALRQRLSLRSQLRAHPGMAAAAVVVFSLPLVALAFVARAVVVHTRRTRSRRGLHRRLRLLRA